MMKMLNHVVGAAMLLLAVHGTAQAEMIFTANLAGSNENPPNGSARTGSATFVLNDAETELSYTVEVFGFDFAGIYTADPNDDISGLHVHAAPAGQNGGVVFGIFSPSQDADVVLNISQDAIQFSGVWDGGDPSNMSLASQLPALKSEGLYLNLHTAAFPGGEIRGQIEAVPEPASAALALIGFGGLFVLHRRQRRR